MWVRIEEEEEDEEGGGREELDMVRMEARQVVRLVKGALSREEWEEVRELVHVERRLEGLFERATNELVHVHNPSLSPPPPSSRGEKEGDVM